MKRAILLLIVIAAVAAWWFLPSREDDRSGPVDTNLPENIDTVILISIDTIRADHMSCYGYGHETTPHIDRLAKDSLFFKDTFSTIPLTLPAHSSMLTGLIPPTHGVRDNFDMYLPDEALTLQEILKSSGYATYGIISAIVLDKRFGMNQGFDVYDDTFVEQADDASMAQRTGKETTEHAIKWLAENRDKKKFMFIHYYDPHTSYSPPEPFRSQFEHPYDGEIAFTDHCIGKVIDQLKSLELYDDALIVVTGDHGEMLGEHNESGHSFFVYQSAIRVPLMFKLPKDAYSMMIAEPCSIIDIAPTILALTGIAIPETMQGINLLTTAQKQLDTPATHFSDTAEQRALYAESLTPTKYNANSLLSVVSGDWHYIQTTDPEIYDRINDPTEIDDLISQEIARADIMQLQLQDILDSSAVSEIDASLDMDDETLRSLESLGYVGGSVSVESSFDESRANPHDVLDVYNDLSRATHLLHQDKFDEAITICQKVIGTHPDIPETHRKLASCYSELQAYQKKIDTLRALLELRPDDFEAHKSLALTYKTIDQTDQAISYTKKALQQRPGDPELSDFLAGLFVKQGMHAEAAPLFLEKLSDKPDDVDTLKNLVSAYNLAHDYRNAAKYCDALFRLLPENVDICSDLAKLHMKSGSYNEAVTFYKQSLALSPDDMNVLKGLADAYTVTGDYDRAIDTLKRIADREPENALVYDRLADVYFKQEAYRKAAESLTTRLALTPKHIGSMQNLVRAYSELGEHQRCIDPLKELLEITPDNVETNYQLAKSYHYLDRYPEAVESCLRTLELDPNHLKAHLCLSQTYLRMNRLKEAIAQYESALKLKPDMLSTHNTIAWLQATQDDPAIHNPESALVHAQKAAELSSDALTGQYTNPQILDTLAAAQAANGQFDAAVETAQQAIELASATGEDKLIQKLQNRLQLYQDGRPYLEKPQPSQDTPP